jgi:segregation and condensation protein A
VGRFRGTPQSLAVARLRCVAGLRRWLRTTPIPVLHLDGFDGPMDLLLDLAERQRIDLGRMSVLALAEQFVAAMAKLFDRVTLEQRADWLVWLRSRLLFPESPEAAADAQRDAATELRRIGALARIRAVANWLQVRPQLGQDVFARSATKAPPSEGGYVALMEACLVVLRGRGGRPEEAPVYQMVVPDLWRGFRKCWRSVLRAATWPSSFPPSQLVPQI